MGIYIIIVRVMPWGSEEWMIFAMQFYEYRARFESEPPPLFWIPAAFAVFPPGNTWHYRKFTDFKFYLGNHRYFSTPKPKGHYGNKNFNFHFSAWQLSSTAEHIGFWVTKPNQTPAIWWAFIYWYFGILRIYRNVWLENTFLATLLVSLPTLISWCRLLKGVELTKWKISTVRWVTAWSNEEGSCLEQQHPWSLLWCSLSLQWKSTLLPSTLR